MSAFMQGYLLIALTVLGVLVLLTLLYAVLGKRFTDKVNIQFHVADDPLHAVGRGTCKALEHTDHYSFLMR